MLDHINIPVSNLQRSRIFYQEVLKPLGIRELLGDEDAIGFGKTSWEFGIVSESSEINKLHVAFAVDSWEAVEGFFQAALTVGGIDNGVPGIRMQYGQSYYAAYTLDLDGHNIEAVCRGVDAGILNPS